MQALYFDMDGTLADLYSVRGWLKKLRNEDVTPYEKAKPLFEMDELNASLEALAAKGVTIGVISWGSKDASKEYQRQIAKAKRAWINKYLPCVSEMHVVKYGTPKARVAKVKNDSILVDDDAQVRQRWIDSRKNKRKAIDPQELYSLLT